MLGRYKAELESVSDRLRFERKSARFLASERSCKRTECVPARRHSSATQRIRTSSLSLQQTQPPLRRSAPSPARRIRPQRAERPVAVRQKASPALRLSQEPPSRRSEFWSNGARCARACAGKRARPGRKV